MAFLIPSELTGYEGSEITWDVENKYYSATVLLSVTAAYTSLSVLDRNLEALLLIFAPTVVSFTSALWKGNGACPFICCTCTRSQIASTWPAARGSRWHPAQNRASSCSSVPTKGAHLTRSSTPKSSCGVLTTGSSW